MIETITNTFIVFSNVLQMLSFIATIVVAIFGYKGLQQLKIAKNSLKTQSQRDARKISADYTYKYLDRILGKDHNIEITDHEKKLLKNFRFSSKDDGSIEFKTITDLDSDLKLNTDKQKGDYTKKFNQQVTRTEIF